MNIFQKISLRNLAWFYGGFFCIPLALMVNLFSSDPQSRFFDENIQLLTKLSESYQAIYQLSGAAGVTKAIHKNASSDSPNIWYVMQESDGSSVLGNLDLTRFSPQLEYEFDFTVGQLTDFQTGDVDIMYVTSDLFDGRQLIIGQDITSRLSKFSYIYWLRWILVTALVLGTVGGLSSGYFILRRLELINATSKNIIETGDLTQRIPVGGAGKDFDALAQNLNSMLDKIQELMISIRRVSDNIAHDLRTPLTRLRHKLDRLESDTLQVDEKKDIVTSLKHEADNLLNIFSALLRITNIESGERHANFEKVPIDQMLYDLVDLYEPIASEKKQKIELDVTPQMLCVDSDLLFQALANILDNAVKYTPIGGNIKLSLQRADKQIKISIADNGIGVENSEIPKLFRRFYRVEQSRNMPGNGLGLSLVAAVVAYHKGTIELQNNQPGLRVILVLPRRKSDFEFLE